MSDLDLSPRPLLVKLASTVIDATVAPLRYRHPILAAELADALLDMRRTVSLADGTLYHYRRTLDSVLRTLPADCPRTVSLSDEGSSLADTLHSWELSLAERYAEDSGSPHVRGRHLRRLIRVHSASGHVVGEHTAGWAASPMLHIGGQSTPLDEFSNAERLAIRDACRARVRALEERQIVGRGLLAQGRDPRGTGWQQPGDVLWAIRHLGRAPGPSIFTNVATHARPPLADAIEPRTSGWARRKIAEAMSYLYPSDVDLIAFRTLLQLETGAAPEEWTGVKIDDIDTSDEMVHVRLHKARAHRSRTVRCPRTSSDGESGWRSGDLIRRVLVATGEARHEANATNASAGHYLFLTVERTSRNRLEVRATPFARRPFSALLSGITPAVSKPHDARRIRKTVKSVRAALLRSADVAADDHSVAVYQRHYAQSTTVHVLAGAAVNAAQTQVFEKLTAGPLFVKDAARTLTNSHDGQLAAAASAEVHDTGVTSQALSPTQCASPYDSPFSPTGRLCEHRPSMCFACPNAIVFADHLPRILAYQEILRGHEKEMPPEQFAAIHGQQMTNIERILREFTATEIETAQRAIDDAGAQVHVPLAQRGAHL